MKRTSAMELTRNLLKERGILGLYRGIGATGLRDVSFSIIYFPLFARLNALGPRRNDGSGQQTVSFFLVFAFFSTVLFLILMNYFFAGEAVFWCSFLSGCAAGSLAALAVNPMDVVKTRLQAINPVEGAAYSGVMDCIL